MEKKGENEENEEEGSTKIKMKETRSPPSEKRRFVEERGLGVGEEGENRKKGGMVEKQINLTK